jgi:hypothetical protein
MHEAYASEKPFRAVQAKNVPGRLLFHLSYFGNEQLPGSARVLSNRDCKGPLPQCRNRRLPGSLSGG